MKRLPIVSCLVTLILGIILLWIASPPARGDFLGEWQIDDYVTITATTHQFSTGAAYAATGNVTYSIYEDSNNAQLVDVNAMTAFDSVTGFYLGRQRLTAALGFQVDKHYAVLIKATVDGVAAITTHNFQVVPTTVGADVLYIKGVDAGDALPDLNDIQDKVEDGLNALLNISGGVVEANVIYILGEAPRDDSWFDDTDDTLATLLTSLLGARVDINDIYDLVDTEIALIIDEIAETEANAVLTRGYALAAQTAAEKIDTASELRTLLNASGGEVANEPNQTTLWTRLPQTLAMAQIGGTGNYYVKVIEPNGSGPLTHQEGAKAATALSSGVWTNTKAGYLDMAISDVNAGGGGGATTDLLTTTVAAGSSPTQFTLTAGPDGNDAYINHSIIVTDANASSYPEARKVISYTGATKTVIVDLPFSFTPAAGDTVAIPRAGYAPSGAGWGMLDPRNIFEIVYAKETTDQDKRNGTTD